MSLLSLSQIKWDKLPRHFTKCLNVMTIIRDLISIVIQEPQGICYASNNSSGKMRNIRECPPPPRGTRFSEEEDTYLLHSDVCPMEEVMLPQMHRGSSEQS